jgi:hypothetical protein
MRRQRFLNFPALRSSVDDGLLLAAAPQPPGIGVLTVAAWAARLARDEDGEHRRAA